MNNQFGAIPPFGIPARGTSNTDWIIGIGTPNPVIVRDNAGQLQLLKMDGVTYATFGAAMNAGTIDAVPIGQSTAALVTAGIKDSATNTGDWPLVIKHNSTGTPAAGFGTGLQFLMDDASVPNVVGAQIDVSWVTAADLSRAAQMIFSVGSTSGVTAALTLSTTVTANLPFVASTIAPPSDGATAIVFTKANLSTNVMVMDSTRQKMLVDFGQSTSLASINGTAHDDVPASGSEPGNSTTTETDIFSYTLPANALATNGDGISFWVCLNTAANANNKTIKQYFGGTLVLNTGAQTANGVTIIFMGLIQRESSTVVKLSIFGYVGSSIFTSYQRVTGLTLSGTNIFKTTGTGVANNDIVGKHQKIEYKSAA